MTTITITFERMPGLKRPPNAMMFVRDTKKPNRISLFTLIDPDWWFYGSCADCHPRDTFSWETGMRLCVKRAASREVYRAFRRWMWLAKAVEECRKHIKPHGCDKCPDYDNDRSCRTLYQPHWWATPESIIAAEFGRVKVAIT